MARITESLELACEVPASDQTALEGFAPTKRCPRCKNMFRTRSRNSLLCLNCLFVLRRPQKGDQKWYPLVAPITDPMNEYEKEVQQLGVKLGKEQLERYRAWAAKQEAKKPKPL